MPSKIIPALSPTKAISSFATTTVKLYTIRTLSDKYTREDVRFVWREVAPWSGVTGEQRREFRLPKYVVTFVTDKSNHIRNFGEGKCKFIALRLCLHLRRY